MKLVIVISVLSNFYINAQSAISLDDAINSALEKNIELQKQKLFLYKSELEFDESARLPNPLLNYSREDLTNNSLTFGEWILSGSMPLNFLWERWSNISSNEKNLQAQKLLFNFQQKNVRSEVQKSFTNLHFTNLMVSDLSDALTNIKNIFSTAKIRFDEGDISEYELQRILVEINKISSLIKKTELSKNEFQKELCILLNTDNFEIITKDSFFNHIISLNQNELVDTALIKRDDFKAIDLLIESVNSQLNFNSMKIIPDINLTAGYKKQTDDLSGLVLELNVQIPIFNRNQFKINENEVELEFLKKQKTFLQNKIEIEVKTSFKKFEEYNLLNQKNDKTILENIISTSAFSYEQGEIELVEFMDAVNTYVDGIQQFYNTKIEFYVSYFELEKTVSSELKNFEN
ncbi:MAG: TolC family protein [Ignavibacteriae bacterium]|nr:TolC family protein [Ignavibacteriota bacterium]